MFLLDFSEKPDFWIAENEKRLLLCPVFCLDFLEKVWFFWVAKSRKFTAISSGLAGFKWKSLISVKKVIFSVVNKHLIHSHFRYFCWISVKSLILGLLRIKKGYWYIRSFAWISLKKSDFFGLQKHNIHCDFRCFCWISLKKLYFRFEPFPSIFLFLKWHSIDLSFLCPLNKNLQKFSKYS